MKIEVESIRKVQGKGKLLAVAVLVLSDKVRLRDVLLVQGQKGMFVAMPARRIEKDGQTQYIRYVEILNKDDLQEVNRAVREAYQKAPEP